MAHLTKATVYNIEDSNIALLGSDLEKHVREEAGDEESAWKDAGSSPGLQIWRIEKFHVAVWPKERVGSFYDGDSYIVLHTYKKTPDAESLSYDLHFWLGQNTTQDEAGTAAYKTVELDDHLHGKPVQFREVQGYESPRFLSYFPRFICLQGGVATGFQHVSDPPPLDIKKLYRVNLSKTAGGRSNLVVREVPATAENLVEGDVYVLDKGAQIWQFNTKASAGQERFKAAEFVQSLVTERQSQSDVTVYGKLCLYIITTPAHQIREYPDEGGSGASAFLREFGEHTTLAKADTSTKEQLPDVPPILFRISDASGTATFEMVEPPTRASLSSQDAFLVDHSSNAAHPAIFVWLGKGASLNERRLAVQYAQGYLYDKKAKAGSGRVRVAIPVVKMQEGEETADFLEAL
ncbi:actin regulatory protein [Crassisporium funariophilum]|nr:actin regulatory protein [Crassisporium funariophilum]